MKKEDCIFCKIAAGEIPANMIWSNEDIVAFHDLNPQAEQHVLIVPRYHSESVLTLAADAKGGELAAKLLASVPEVAKELGVDQSGFRLIVNCGAGAGQTIMHLHLHLLAGEELSEKMV